MLCNRLHQTASLVALIFTAACGGGPLTAPYTASHDTRSPSTSGYQTIYSFLGNATGAYPNGLLVSSAGSPNTLYGTTTGNSSGSTRDGTVYQITTFGREHTIYAFKFDAGPNGVIVDNGKLYGTTAYGGSGCGSFGCGTFFAVTFSGHERQLYAFLGGSDGNTPTGNLIARQGEFIGMTSHGGSASCESNVNCGYGVVFEVSRTGSEQILHRFTNSPDGAYPSGVVDVAGTLYGTTAGGGRNGKGTVFTIDAKGSERVLYSFKAGRDGAAPLGPLTSFNGAFYGTTAYGGSQSSACGGKGSYSDSGCGTVFEISTKGRERVIYRFKNAPDGANPEGALIVLDGNLYGVTRCGGDLECGSSQTCYSEYSFGTCGAVYEVTAGGKETVLYELGAQPASVAQGPVGLVALNGVLYGTTQSGGSYNLGTVYAITP